MDKDNFLTKFVLDLQSLGVQSGGVLMVHSALRPFVNVPGGPETIIQGLLDTLGKNGTLLMPALSYETVTPQNPVFNIHSTPTCVGAISEYFRLRAGTQRSLHPTHSVCAVGPLAEKLMIHHIEDSTPCGPQSPFSRLPDINGQILFLSCSLIYNTSMHAIEEWSEPPYLYNPPIIYTLNDEKGQITKKEYIPHNFKGWGQKYDRIEEILAEPGLRSGTVMGVTSFLLDAKALWETALIALKENNLFFVEETIT